MFGNTNKVKLWLAVGYAGRQSGKWRSSIGAYMQSELLHNTVHLPLHAVCLSLSLLDGNVLRAFACCCTDLVCMCVS